MDTAYKISAVLLLAVAVPATAQTFGFALGPSARSLCLSIGDATYRIADGAAAADYTVRIDPSAPAPDVRVHLAGTADEADFVLVDDGEARATCAAPRRSAIKTVRVSPTAATPDLTIGLAPSDSADYRIYVRSQQITAEAVAALFAVARKGTHPALAQR